MFLIAGFQFFCETARCGSCVSFASSFLNLEDFDKLDPIAASSRLTVLRVPIVRFRAIQSGGTGKLNADLPGHGPNHEIMTAG